MLVTLNPGESVTVEFAGTDGSIEVSFTMEALIVKAADEDDFQRQGVLWHAGFAVVNPPDDVEG